MFVKKSPTAEQFEFATIMSTAMHYKENGVMPSYDVIEVNTMNLLQKSSLYLTEIQLNKLKAISITMSMSTDIQNFIKQMAKDSSKTDGKAYAEIVLRLKKGACEFI